jgi:hypothetical protein
VVPVLAAGEAWLLFGEKLSAIQVPGFALALPGVVLARRMTAQAPTKPVVQGAVVANADARETAHAKAARRTLSPGRFATRHGLRRTRESFARHAMLRGRGQVVEILGRVTSSTGAMPCRE